MQALDVLFLTLAVCAAVLTVFVSVTLVYLMFILRDVTQIADQARGVVDKVDRYITKPILLTKSLMDFVAPFIPVAQESVKKRSRSKSK